MHDSDICHKPQPILRNRSIGKADHACVFFVAFLVALTTIPVSVSGLRVLIAVPQFWAANGLPYLGFRLRGRIKNIEPCLGDLF
jgi:hypothetical protein